MNDLISGLFILLTLSCILLGFYFLYINMNGSLNKLAFLICISLSCWNLGMFLSLMASDYTNSIIWKRFAAIGVGTFFGFCLHYILILSKHHNFLKKKWSLSLIYVPSFIIVYLLVFSKMATGKMYQLKKTPLGWMESATSGYWNVLLTIYMISNLAIGLYIVYKWKQKMNETSKKRQANYIYLSFIVCIAATLIVEVLDYLRIDSYLREFLPFLYMLLTFSLCSPVFLKHSIKENLPIDDVTFITQFREKITKYLAVCFCIGGVLAIITPYLCHKNIVIEKLIGFSALLFFYAIAIYVVYRLTIKNEMKIFIYSFLLSLVIPIITLHYLKDASVTIWVFPFIILMAILLFNNKAMLTMVSTSMVLTELYMWIAIPRQIVTVDTLDYLVRIGFIGLAIALIYYINNVYVLRVNQLSDRIRAQELLFLISSHVIKMNDENIKEKMDEILALICEYVMADRAHVYFWESKNTTQDSEYYSWCDHVSTINKEDFQDINKKRFFWLEKQIKKAGVVQISDLSKLPDEAKKEKEFLSNQQVKSMIVFPLLNQENIIGFFRIDYVTDRKSFDDSFVKNIMTIGNILGEAYGKTCSERKMVQMSYYDPLTNIPNRQLFSKCMNKVIENSNQNGGLFGIIFLDLDSFKMVNDTLGHHYGDKILIMIADRLARCVRKTDTVCRFGGDEFLIMLNDVQCKADIETVATKIINRLEKPLFINDQEFNITASVGISIFPIDGLDNDTLIKNADIAMYKAKSSGRNQFAFCSTEMKEEIEQSLILTNNLYHAQERNELDIVYQPQIDLETGQIIAIEALARWYHPKLGAVSPGIFIPIAEHTSLIISIGEWILRKACEQNKMWQDKGLKPVRIAVNVSVNQLLKSNFVYLVKNILEETGLNPQYLELEITENLAIQESDYIVKVLSELKELGVSLAIDDFGIEYSSLNRIKMLPIDRLKIDMHFVKGILNCDKDKVIVDVIIKLAKDLKLKVIAEGVEKKEQLEYLITKQCDEIQGYYFYKPLTNSEFEKVLINQT